MFSIFKDRSFAYLSEPRHAYDGDDCFAWCAILIDQQYQALQSLTLLVLLGPQGLGILISWEHLFTMTPSTSFGHSSE